jgi:simple sugar transport system ATP-binding protein
MALMDQKLAQNEKILTMEGIDISFPGVHALDNVDFTLRSGEIHALMGENGAGKSTLIKVLTGVYNMDAGNIVLEGKPTVIHSPQEARKLGISTVYQEVNLCPNLTLLIGKKYTKNLTNYYKNLTLQ